MTDEPGMARAMVDALDAMAGDPVPQTGAGNDGAGD